VSVAFMIFNLVDAFEFFEVVERHLPSSFTNTAQCGRLQSVFDDYLHV